MKRFTFVPVVFALVLLPGCAARTVPSPDAAEFTAFAVDQTGGGAGVVQISIDRWTTDQQRADLIRTLQEKGPDALLDTLQDIPEVGRIRTPDSLGYPLHYAHREPLEDGGEKIVIATDRRISFWEQVNQPRSIEYPFTLIQMQIGPEGRGEGRLLAAARIIAHDNIIEVEHFSMQPVVLNQVRRVETTR